MADRPILFSAPMVLALLAGRKTQTRRILKLPKWASTDPSHIEFGASGAPEVICRETGCLVTLPLPYAGGDRLWVKETWAAGSIYDGMPPRDINPGGKSGWCGIRYAATDERNGIKDRPSLFMPRWASRLTLLVTDVQAERLQDLSEGDAQAEGIELESADPPFHYVPGIWPHSITAVGVEEPGGRHAARSFAKLWEHINGPESWQANPWVVVVGFSVHARNIDQLAPIAEAAE